MIRPVIVVSIAVLTSGCFQFHYQRSAVYAKNNAALNSLNEKCSALTFNSSDLIYDEINTPENKESFVKNVCFSQIDDECRQKFSKMHFARMQEKYIGADWDACKLYADGHPEVYSNSRTIELVVLHSHNLAVKQLCDKNREAIAENTNAALEQINNNQQAAIAQAIKSMSEGFGSKSSTTCHSSGDTVKCYHR